MNDNLKILILEDSASDAELMQRFLKNNGFDFSAKIVDTRHAFIKELENFSPNLVLSDHKLPQFDSFDALKILKGKQINIPFILVTGTVSEEFAATIIKEGADDYILKNNLTRLPNAIKTSLEKKQAEREKEIHLQEIEDKINEINTFIYRISHDLKAPLASTIGIINIIKNEFKDERFLVYVDMIEKSNKKMENILLGFAEVVKITQGNAPEEKINLKKLIEETIENLKNIPKAEGIKFTFDINPEIEISINPGTLNSILQNLIFNAINYRRNLPDSFINTKVSETENSVIIEISDNGIGIEKKLQPKIFDMFYRANEASTGSGLGLYIVKKGLEKSGGKIKLKSVAGIGTTFTIILPKNQSL